MEEYIGLDVSMKETAIAIRRDGVRVWRGKCASDPHVIAELIRKRAPMVNRAVFETGRSRCGSIMRFEPRACLSSALMCDTLKRLSTWQRTKRTRMTLMG
ncbi:hypothetical protein DSM25559_4954 [Agrobacterium rosae]|uniref:Uncharacterized protein n=1 Tax=Agrobacterium rosae TaxID=1972867 RepID=A0A1R3U2I0_9HYPH|nr:hypothetical protein DSM25559_4954 [Agrobacterium rosae]